MAEQVRLITSLPSEAAQRVHDLTIEGITQGTRASEIAKKIMEAGDVTASRANMIARTEVSRTATLLTQARAEYVGSDGYIWRTSGDSDVRPSHKAMNGKFVRWSELPELDGMVGHAGALPNCRCYPEPVIPDD
nr:phage minor head protein [Pseudochelatococcus contaminans]